MLNRIRTGGDCDAADYVVLSLGVVLLTPVLTILQMIAISIVSLARWANAPGRL